jgi:hypothetical protein
VVLPTIGLPFGRQCGCGLADAETAYHDSLVERMGSSRVPILSDIATGNMALFEALVLTLGFRLLGQARPFHFVAWILLAAAFKVLPIVFLMLLVLGFGGPKRLHAFLIGIIGFILLAGLNCWLYPLFTQEFLEATFEVAQSPSERGVVNPSLGALTGEWHDQFPALPVSSITGLLATSIVCITFIRLRTLKLDYPKVMAIFFIVAALVLPRFKIYSYLQLLPAACIILAGHRGATKAVLTVMLCAPLPYTYLLIGHNSWNLLFAQRFPYPPIISGYLSYYTTGLLWLFSMINADRLFQSSDVADPDRG